MVSWVGEALDGQGSWSLRAKAPWILGTLMLFDSWDSVVIAYTLPLLIGQWKLSALQSGWLISAGYGMQFVGAIAFGKVAARRGRLPVFRWLVLAMCLLAIACALADSYYQLCVLRALQGLTIGGALPVAMCYINEIAPTATRGRFFGTFQFLMTSGFGLAALSGAWLIPVFGWRIMFGLGALPLIVLPFAIMFPESPRWLASRGRTEEAARSLEDLGAGPLPQVRPPTMESHEKVPLAALLSGDIRHTSIVTGLLWFVTFLVSSGLVTWLPSIYVSLFKISVTDALRYNLIVAVSVFILPVLLRASIDRIGRRPPPMFGTAIGGLALLAMVFIPVTSRALLVGCAIIGQIGISIGCLVLWPYTAEIYPTRIRSLALGTASSLARAASMLTPLLVGGLLQLAGSVNPVFVVFGFGSFAVALLWFWCVRETAGQQVAE